MLISHPFTLWGDRCGNSFDLSWGVRRLSAVQAARREGTLMSRGRKWRRYPQDRPTHVCSSLAVLTSRAPLPTRRLTQFLSDAPPRHEVVLLHAWTEAYMHTWSQLPDNLTKSIVYSDFRTIVIARKQKQLTLLTPSIYERGGWGCEGSFLGGNPQTQEAECDNPATLHLMPLREGGFGLRLVFSVTTFFLQ